MVAYARRMFNGGAIQTTVPLAIGSSDGSFTLATGGSTNWPDGSTGNFVIIIDVGTPEKILCSARSGLVVTVAASGRGYDGTSAASHPAGSAIQVIHCAQDDDEANQVVSAVLGQSGAAKGDILAMLSAAGPNTLTRVGIGATGALLSVASALPSWVAPGATGSTLSIVGGVPTWGGVPYIKAHDSGGTTLGTNTYTHVNLATTDFSGYGLTVVSNNIVVALAGIYRVEALADITITAGTASVLSNAVYQNGSAVLESVFLSSTTSNWGTPVSGLVKCAASDTIALWALCSSASATTVNTAKDCYISMSYVGPV